MSICVKWVKVTRAIRGKIIFRTITEGYRAVQMESNLTMFTSTRRSTVYSCTMRRECDMNPGQLHFQKN